MRRFFVILAIPLILSSCYATTSEIARDTAAIASRKRTAVQGIEILPLPSSLQDAFKDVENLEKLSREHEAVCQQADIYRFIQGLAAPRAPSSQALDPYQNEYGIGTMFQYVDVPRDGQKRQEILEKLSTYSQERLTSDRFSRNSLIVAISLWSKEGERIGPILYAGNFVSGAEDYQLRQPSNVLRAQDIKRTIAKGAGVIKEIKRKTGIQEDLDFDSLESRLRQDYCIDGGDPRGALFTKPLLVLEESDLMQEIGEGAAPRPAGGSTFSIRKMPLLTLSMAYRQPDVSEWSMTHHENMQFFLLPDLPKMVGAERGPLRDILGYVRSLFAHKEYANHVCRALFDNPAINGAPKEHEGSFDGGFESAFYHSEQAFLQILSKRLLINFLIKPPLQAEALIQDINAVETIRFEFLSQKDVCAFCRGTLSCLLSSPSEGKKSWFADRAREFLEQLYAPTSGGPAPAQIARSPKVQVFAYSIELAERAQRQEAHIALLTT